MTATTAAGTATVAISGGADVTARGLCWNTTGTPTISDNLVSEGSGTGSFTGKLTGLSEGPTYYVRAYATNSEGTVYSPSVTSFKICPKSFSVTHTEGVNGAPVTKTVTYHSVSSNISGSPACWLTQNLGADREAMAVSDATELSAGWYWQFNRLQGYKHDGTTRTPSDTWPSISESSDWLPGNDPCSLLLGTGWRIPTEAEWKAAGDPPQNWGSPADAYNSVLKLHQAGYLTTGGALTLRGSYGLYWSSTQASEGQGRLRLVLSTYSIYSYSKAQGQSLRCIRESVSQSVPTVSNVSVPDSTLGSTMADCTATVTINGEAEVTERGFCWNTNGTAPVVIENKIAVGSGSFTGTMGGLSEGSNYYVRAYATNSEGTAYSPSVTSFKICPKSFSVTHTEGVNGAPVTKTVTYHSVSSNISGSPACWLTQNLGANRQATAVSDATESSAGWYWQFNCVQGYKHDGSTRIPSTWTTSIVESSDWLSSNDLCSLLLGTGWRIPTNTEWTAADAIPQYWTTGTDAWSSVLKLHYAGYLNYSTGVVENRGLMGVIGVNPRGIMMKAIICT